MEAESKTGETMNMLNAMVKNAAEKCEGEWALMSLAIDSGAAETVIPHTMVTEYPVVETPKSTAGLCYASATGAPIPNLGEQCLPLATADGSLRMMTFHRRRPRESVRQADGDSGPR